ncbi:hypothetical protein ACOME3_002848 [Neoechinorhynchus agilis]
MGIPSPNIQTTSISFPVNENPDKIFITGLKEHAFIINRTLTVYGPIICFPWHILHWNVSDVSSINAESLCLLSVLYPKPDLFILGIGDSWNLQKPIGKNSSAMSLESMKEIRSFLTKHSITHEILPTEKAIQAFNVLNSEYRVAVAAMLPVRQLRRSQLDSHTFENIGKPLRFPEVKYHNEELEKYHEKIGQRLDDAIKPKND